MAAYGPNAGVVPFTGWSPTLGVVDAVTPSAIGQVQFSGMTQADSEIAREFFTVGRRASRKLLLTLLGVVAGTTATENQNRVAATTPFLSANQGGGVVTIEQVALVNRATTAGDITNLTALLSRSPVPSSYAADASGNGGGGKLGI